MAAAISPVRREPAMTRAAPATTATGKAHSWKTPRSFGLTLAIASAAFSFALAIASARVPSRVADRLGGVARARDASAASRAARARRPARRACGCRRPWVEGSPRRGCRAPAGQSAGEGGLGRIGEPVLTFAPPASTNQDEPEIPRSRRSSQTLYVAFPLADCPYLAILDGRALSRLQLPHPRRGEPLRRGRRRRAPAPECPSCGHRFTTYERVAPSNSGSASATGSASASTARSSAPRSPGPPTSAR